jgi:hypothetical protein
MLANFRLRTPMVPNWSNGVDWYGEFACPGYVAHDQKNSMYV